MNNWIYLLLAVLILILLGVIGILFVLIFKLLKQQSNSTPQPTSSHETPGKAYHPEIQARLDEAKKFKPLPKQSVFCPNHPEEVGETTCAICGKFFCKRCLRPFKTMHFCKEHLAVVMKNEWEEVITIKSHTDDPEAGVKLIETKQKWWNESELPTYIETHYKIDVDHDYIETYLVLFSTKDQLAEVKKKIEDLKLDSSDL